MFTKDYEEYQKINGLTVHIIQHPCHSHAKMVNGDIYTKFKKCVTRAALKDLMWSTEDISIRLMLHFYWQIHYSCISHSHPWLFSGHVNHSLTNSKNMPFKNHQTTSIPTINKWLNTRIYYRRKFQANNWNKLKILWCCTSPNLT